MLGMTGWFSSFYRDYISVNLEDYPNIGVDLDIVKLIFITAAVICASFCVIDYHKKHMYLVVKQLMRHEARDETSAKTLAEIGLANNEAIKKALSGSSQMKSVVSCVGEKKQSYDEYILAQKRYRELKKAARAEKKQMRRDGLKEERVGLQKPDICAVDFESARFFINPNGKDRASKIYNSAEITAARTALRCLLTVAIAVCFVLIMPELLSWINGWMG